MLHAASLLFALSSALSPESPWGGVCGAAQQASLTVAQTVTLLDVTVGARPLHADGTLAPSSEEMLHARGHMVPTVQPAHFHLELPRLSLGWLSLNAVGITISISFLAGTSCAAAWAWNDRAADLTEMVPIPSATVAIRYRPMVATSLLAPWQTLLTRLGENPAAHASVTVGVGVASTMMMGGAMRPYGTTLQPGTQGSTTSTTANTPWAVPTLRAPSMPSVPVSGRGGGSSATVRGVRR